MSCGDTELSFKQRVWLILIDKGILALLFATAMIVGNYVVSDKVSKNRAFYDRRVTRVEELWASVYQYGIAVNRAIDSTDTMVEAVSRLQPDVERFERDVTNAGLFLGIEQVDSIRRRLLVPLLRMTKGSDRDGFRVEFVESWTNILTELETR